MTGNPSRRKKRLLIWSFISFGMIIIFLISPTYLKRAVIYNFVDIDDYHLFNNRTVASAQEVPWPNSSGFNQYQIEGNDLDTLEKYETVAFLLICNDSVLNETYWDDYNENSLSNSFSAAKSIVSLLIGIAVDNGDVKSIDQPVKDFIPDLKNTTNEILTIRHLLNMSSGSSWDESYASPFSMTTKAYYGTDLNELISNVEIVRQPGVYFQYQSGNTQILAKVLENATHKTLSEYASEKIWQKVGASGPALWSLDKKDGEEKAYCCFNSNARDFARLGAVVLHNGFFNNAQVVSQKYLDEMTTPVTYLTDLKDNHPVNFYGLHWWIVNYKGQDIPYARGILGQYIFVLRDQNAILVRLGHKRSKIYINHHPSEIYSYLDLAMKMLGQEK